jgi:ribonuclease VapC
VNLFDSSALLCFFQGEAGSDTVAGALAAPSGCSAANWSELAQELRQHSQDWSLAKTLLGSFGLNIIPVLAVDAEVAAEICSSYPNLSLGDRLCLATGTRLNAVIWTADKAWGPHEFLQQIR